MLKKDSFAEAINLLVEAEQENPNNYKIKRDLGVAYYKTEQLDKALDKLQEAKTMQAADSKTIFYLGLTYESKDMLTEAINEYKNYKNLGRSRRFRNEISKRIKQ
ncbi:MAG: tetratricopeptide repeat protein, partial [bacterium]